MRFDYNAVDVWLTENEIFVKLDTGQQASLPISKFPLLRKATPAQRKSFILKKGYALHWPEIGEDLSIAGFFE